MKLTHLIIFLIFFLINDLNAKPRCDLFYDEVYSLKTFPTDEDRFTVGDAPDIGIELLWRFNKEKNISIPVTNKEGYFVVGKVTQYSLLAQNGSPKQCR